MSGNLSVSPQPLVWNEKTILENGIPFLKQKKEALNVYQKIWDASIGADYYSSASITEAKRFKVVAETSRKEIEALDQAVIQLLDVELAKNPSLEQTKQLSKIALASRSALNYFTSAIKDTYYPTLINWTLRESVRGANKLAFSTTVLVITTNFAENISGIRVPFDYLTTPWKVSLASCLIFNAIRYLNTIYRINPSVEQVETLKNTFEEAITPEKITA